MDTRETKANQTTSAQSLPPILDSEKYKEAVIKMATDQRAAGQLVTGSKIVNDGSMLRDYSNIAILALGGAITFLTVAQDLIKTMWLFVASIALLTVAVILSLIARRSIYAHLDKTLQAHETHYAKLAGYATLAWLNPNDEGNQTRLSDTMSNPFVPPGETFWVKYGATIVNGFFISGFLGLGIALVFKITS